MVIDTSALLEILQDEPEREIYAQAIASLRSRTIFEVRSTGVRTAVVTAKDTLRRQLGRGLDVGAGNVCFSSQHADRGTAAEHGIDDALGFVGQPLPDMYSMQPIALRGELGGPSARRCA